MLPLDTTPQKGVTGLERRPKKKHAQATRRTAPPAAAIIGTRGKLSSESFETELDLEDSSVVVLVIVVLVMVEPVIIVAAVLVVMGIILVVMCLASEVISITTTARPDSASF